MPSCQLYLVTPPNIDPATFRDRLAAALDAGPVAALQLWLPDLADDDLRRAIDTLRPIAQAREVAFLLNGRPDLARETGCDGAHIDPEAMPVEQARRSLGTLQLGVSCYDSRDLAMAAGDAGADYVSFGAFFPSTTKQARTWPGPELLAWWSELMEPPVVAIGGITAGNCRKLVEAGADFLAVVNAVWGYPDGEAAGVRAMIEAMAG